MKKICPKCDGLGVIEKEGKLYECECERIRRIALSMPVFIRKAPVEDGHVAHILVDLIKKDCFVIAAWADMKAIVKIAMLKHWPKLIRITSDAEIRNVFVGGASKNARAEGFEGEIYNNLQDFMDPPDLMIVRLGELSYKNKAAAGALEEAVSYRLDRSKPTWVLSDTDKPFSIGSHAYSKSVEDLFRTAFEQVYVNRIATRLIMDRGESQISISGPMVQNVSHPGMVSSPVLSVEPVESVGELLMPGSTGKSTHKPKPFGREESKPKPRVIRSIPDDDGPDTQDDELNKIGSGVSKGRKFQGRS